MRVIDGTTYALCQKQMNALQQAPWSGCSENTSSGAQRVCAYGKRITAKSSVSLDPNRGVSLTSTCVETAV